MINNSVVKIITFFLFILFGVIVYTSVYFFIKKLAKKIIKVDASTWTQTGMAPFSKNNHYNIILSVLLFGGSTYLLFITIKQYGSVFLFFLISVFALTLFPGDGRGLPKNTRTLKGWIIGSTVAACTFFTAGLIIFIIYQLYFKNYLM